MLKGLGLEHNGTPIDVDLLGKIRDRWDDIKDQLIVEIDSEYGVFDGLTFKHDRFDAWLTKAGIPWPRLPSGKLDMKADTFKEQVGGDGRNRTMLSAFRAATGRNQPSSNKFIFGTSAWLRGLIKPTAGQGLAYIDYSQQELQSPAC
jgi:DNA polymerase-1